MFQRFIYSVSIFAVTGILHSYADDATSTQPCLRDTLPSTWRYMPEHSIEVPSGNDSWWSTFNDNTLDTLIALGVENNYNLAMAMRRTEIARNAMGQARSAWFPSIGLNLGWSKNRESGMTSSAHTPAMNMSYFSAGLSASWEIDIFGKIASGVKAKKAGYRASKAEYSGAMLSICSQIASTYVSLRMYQELLAIAEEHTESQMKIVEMAKARYDADLASKLDVAQALEVYYSTMASIPMLRNSIHTSINALAVLTAEPFGKMEAMLKRPAPLPSPDGTIGIGVPMDLLRRRPDIVQAEMELAQYAAQVGIAKKDFLPTLTLNGSIGTSAHRAGDLFSHDSFTYSIAPALSWTIFDGLGRKYAVAAAKEALQAGIDNYNLTVMTAVEEADNALSTYQHSLLHVDAVTQMIIQNDEALKLAIDRYKNSLSPMSDVVTAQLNALSAASELVSARGSALASLISLYEALGGGISPEQ